jgi:hypothetical protein
MTWYASIKWIKVSKFFAYRCLWKIPCHLENWSEIKEKNHKL